MILSKKDYIAYLEADRVASARKKPGLKQKLSEWVAPDYIWKFQRLLRKAEYYKNVKKDPFSKIIYFFVKMQKRRLGVKLGFSIPENVFGPGLSLPHYGTIVVNAAAKVGANCRMHVCTNIGASGGSPKAPQIGDNVYIAPGVKIFGDIRLGNNIAIGANAVVNCSFEEDNILIAGVPAKKIKSIEENAVKKAAGI